MAMMGERVIELPFSADSRNIVAQTEPAIEVTVLLDRAIVDQFKAVGSDWRERMEEILRSATVK